MRPMARFPGKLAVPCAMPISSPSRRTLPKHSIMAISAPRAIPAGTRRTKSTATRLRGTGSFLSLSCRHTKDEKHCDEAQGNRELPVSLLQEDCISYFSFDSDGEIFANAERTEEEQERASATISILRLNTSSLVTARYDAIEELESLSVEERKPLLDLLCRRNARGAFVPYYFVPLRHFQRI